MCYSLSMCNPQIALILVSHLFFQFVPIGYIASIILGNYNPTFGARYQHRNMTTPHSVYVTLQIPPRGMELLRASNLQITQWESKDPLPREELLKNVKGKDAVFCAITDRIDKEFLDAAGNQFTQVVFTGSFWHKLYGLCFLEAERKCINRKEKTTSLYIYMFLFFIIFHNCF